MPILPPDRLPIPRAFETLEAEARLPFPGTSSDSSSSVVSPLSLLRNPGHYFDSRHSTATSHLAANHFSSPSVPMRESLDGISVGDYTPSPSNGRGPPRAQPAAFLSPTLAPVSTQIGYQRQFQRQPRSASLSPTRKASGGRATAMSRTRSAMVSPMRAPATGIMLPAGSIPGLSSAASGLHSNVTVPAIHPRSVSADVVSITSQEDRIRRLEDQNAKIKLAWEAERKQLQQSRDIAEEVYLEERQIMEEDRRKWEAEREVLETEIQLLKERLVLAEAGVPSSALILANGHVSQNLRGGGHDTTSPDSNRGSQSSQGSGNGIAAQGNAFSTAAEHGLNGHGPARISPLRQPDMSPFIPISQHLPGNLAGTGEPMATVEEQDENPGPVVDVHEIHPALEGIWIKSDAIQKPTFTDKQSPSGSQTSSRNSSPPNDPTNSRPRAGRVTTLKVLAADENVRLVMHAGHTPNHSLSVIPSANSTVAATTASSSGSNTPTLIIGSEGATDSAAAAAAVLTEVTLTRSDGLQEPQPTADPAIISEEPEALLEASEDVKLTGPLTLRNHPAKDEAFLRRLSDKLERVNSGEDSVPTVLKSSPVESEAPTIDAAEQAETQSQGGDAANDSAEQSDAETEEVIPLKLKISNNFGAPFGAFR